MFKLCDRITFWIRLSTDLDPTRSFIVSSRSTDHPPNTPTRMSNCFTSYPGYCCFSSHLRGPYLAVFSASLIALLSIHGQLISITATRFLSFSITRASILLAFTITLSEKTSTFQKILALSFSCIGLGWTCEYHDGTLDTKF